MARSAWYAVTLQNAGKITAPIWRHFCVEFRAAMQNVPDITEGEARRLLMSKVQSFMAKWVVEYQESQNRMTPTVSFSCGMDISEATVKQASLRFTGQEPKKLSEKRGMNFVWYLMKKNRLLLIFLHFSLDLLS